MEDLEAAEPEAGDALDEHEGRHGDIRAENEEEEGGGAARRGPVLASSGGAGSSTGSSGVVPALPAGRQITNKFPVCVPRTGRQNSSFNNQNKPF